MGCVRRRGRVVGAVAMLLGILLVLGVPWWVLAQDTSEDGRSSDPAGPACPATDIEANKAIVSRWYEDVVNGQRSETIHEVLAGDVVVHPADGTADEAGVDTGERRLRDQANDVPDLFTQVKSLIGEGDRVAAVVTREWARADGQLVGQTSTELYSVACGRIAELWPAASVSVAAATPAAATPAAPTVPGTTAAVGCGPTVPPCLVADPNPVPAGAGLGTTAIAWATADDAFGDVYVSVDGGPEALFARRVSGTKIAPWIAAGRTYTFRLYAGRERARVLATVTVTREEAATPAA